MMSLSCDSYKLRESSPRSVNIEAINPDSMANSHCARWCCPYSAIRSPNTHLTQPLVRFAPEQQFEFTQSVCVVAGNLYICDEFLNSVLAHLILSRSTAGAKSHRASTSSSSQHHHHQWPIGRRDDDDDDRPSRTSAVCRLVRRGI